MTANSKTNAIRSIVLISPKKLLGYLSADNAAADGVFADEIFAYDVPNTQAGDSLFWIMDATETALVASAKAAVDWMRGRRDCVIRGVQAVA